jgi:lipoprotein-anchoring transpeptidase ErfK/SrfK
MRRQINKQINKNSKNLQARIRVIAAGALIALITILPAAAQSAETTEKPERQIVVSIPHRQLAVVEAGQVVKIYAVAVGADESPSPEGDFTVTRRLENPTYYHPGKVIGPGKSNPLGTRWIGLNKKGYGIHGTNVPASIGKAAYHGCIRMRQADLEELFAMTNVGDKVVIRKDVDAEVAQIFSTDSQDGTTARTADSAAVDSTN